jgi:hypothetical protein
MNDLLAYQVILSFIIGGAFVSCSMMIAERFGSTIGGVIGGVPSTTAISLFFIAISSGINTAVAAAGIIPMLMGFCGIFLISYAFFSRVISPVYSLVFSLIVWLALSASSFLFSPISFITSLGMFLVLLVLCGVAALKWLQLPVSKGENRSAESSSIFRKGLLAGTIIGGAVLAAKMGGAAIGAIFAGFPAMYLSTMWVTSSTHGVRFSHSLIIPLLFSGLINVTFYASGVRLLYPKIGIIGGTAASYGLALISAALVYMLVRRLTADFPASR